MYICIEDMPQSRSPMSCCRLLRRFRCPCLSWCVHHRRSPCPVWASPPSSVSTRPSPSSAMTLCLCFGLLAWQPLCRCSLLSGDIAWLVQWSRPASVASGPPAVRGLFRQAAVPQCRVAAEAALPSARQPASFPCWLALIPGATEGGAVTVVVDRRPRHRRRRLGHRSRLVAAIVYYFAYSPSSSDLPLLTPPSFS